MTGVFETTETKKVIKTVILMFFHKAALGALHTAWENWLTVYNVKQNNI